MSRIRCAVSRHLARHPASCKRVAAMNGIRGLAAVALLLAGCKLIDQTTFAPSPEATPSAEQIAKVDARTALLTINYTEPNPSYQDVLRYAVRTAETRAPGVQY